MVTNYARSRTVELTAVIGTICAFSFIAGFIYPVIALSLESWGYDEAAIGLNATASGAGIVVAGLMIPCLVRLFGTFSLLAGGVLLCVVCLLLLPVFQNYWAWLAIRFFMAMSTAALFAVGEAWINAVAHERSRGRTVAIYVAAMSLSFAIGSGAVTLTGYVGWLPFLTASMIVVLCFVPVLPFHHRDPLAETDSLGEKRDLLWQVLRQTVVLVTVVAVFGALNGVILGLFPSYELAKGVADIDAPLPLAAMAFGTVALQFPLGYLADRMPRMRLLGLVLISVVVLAPIVPHIDLISPLGLLFITLFGGLSFAPYTLALAVLGERYRGQRLAAGSALFAIMFGVGGTVGPYAFGLGMAWYGVEALPYGLAILFLGTALIVLMERVPTPVNRKA